MLGSTASAVMCCGKYCSSNIIHTYYYFFKQLSISHVFRQLTYLLFHPPDDCFDADISTKIHNDNLPMRTDVYYLVFDFLIHKHMPYLPPVLITYSIYFLHNYLCRPFFLKLIDYSSIDLKYCFYILQCRIRDEFCSY